MPELTTDFVARLRTQFPALARHVNGKPAVFLDGPAGTQVPQRVIDAVSRALGWTNANHGGLFQTSIESDAMLDEAHRATADFVGAADPDCVAFGANMTSLTFAFSRALARQWKAGDEIVVTRLDHDANVTPWVLAARDAGVMIRIAEMRQDDGTLDTDHLKGLLSPRTKLVALGAASNSTGSINPIGKIVEWSHEAGALVFVDAVHYAPHQLPDVTKWNCDFLACSAYKFFGPHVGILWGKRPLMESLAAYKVRPAPDSLPGKWMTGTQNHEGIAGVLAAIDYLADLGREVTGDSSLARRPALAAAYDAILAYERKLLLQLLRGLAEQPAFQVRGVTEPARISERMPTISITHARLPSADVARRLGELGVFAWHGNYYALGVTESLGLEPQGMVRLGLVHYNTEEEVARTVQALRSIG